MPSTLWLRVCVAVTCTSLFACAGIKPGASTGAGGTGAASAGAGSGGSGAIQGTGGLPGPAPGDDGGPTGPHSVCGDGVRGTDEACDDGNAAGGDGCAADCHSVDSGYSCTPVGAPCHRIARCGDGVVVPPELCDDGNTKAGDGCSASCKVELGSKCSGSPSQCAHTMCGDNKVEGAESCDDGNPLPFDGCSADCQNEPGCATGACTSKCGDGIVVHEDCDDGNNVDGDGCSANCKIEPGYMCKQPPLGDKLLVPAIFRDFRAKNPMEFEPPGATGLKTALTGLVKPDLDAEGKPVYTGLAITGYTITAATFAEWYRDTPNVNHSTSGKLTLWNNGKGAYVNRYGANGEQWPLTITAYYCGNVGQEQMDPVTGLAIPCTSRFGPADCDKYAGMPGYTRTACTVSGGSYQGTFQTGLLDGTPLFFPVDGDTFTPASERVSATIGGAYGNDSPEPGTPKHNFSFTSEVRYWFQYDATKTYTLEFTGDDDVWVFINRKLAVDLGGIHTPAPGAVTFGAGMPAKFGLADGQVYEVVVFQAERKTTGSSYRLTLSGFNASPSDCKPICGDGILGIGEECDDGKNPGGYGACGADCKLGEYCGDGIVQPDHEDCDDGVNIGKPCPSGCKRLIIN